MPGAMLRLRAGHLTGMLVTAELGDLAGADPVAPGRSSA